MKIQRQRETFAFRLGIGPGEPMAMPPPPTGGPPPEDKRTTRQFWGPAVDMVKQQGAQPREVPVPLKGGGSTNIYLDPKHILSNGRNMKLASQAMLEHAKALGIDYNGVGGPTMGADAISHGMVAHSENPDMNWFTVRDKPKTTHGLGNWIEGAHLGPGHKVILTDDVADSGQSLEDAYHRVSETGAQVSAVMPLVERGDATAARFAKLGVSYHPLMNYHDLGIDTLQKAR